MVRFWLATSALALTSACATVQMDPTLVDAPLADSPQNWAAGELPSAAPEGDWVRLLEMPGLDLVVDEALSANLDLAAAALRYDQAVARAKAASAGRLPNVNLSGSVNAVESVFDSSITDGMGNVVSDAPQRNFSLSSGLDVRATWDPDIWGRLRDAEMAGRLNAEAFRADLQAARLSVAGRAAQAWVSLTEAQRLYQLAVDDLATQESSLGLVQRRFERGLSGALDVRLARSSVETAKATLALRERQRNASARVLEVLLGRYPAAEIAAPAEFPQLKSIRGVGAPADLLARRPDLAAAELRLAASGLQVDQARKAMRPGLNFTGTLSTGADALGELFDPQYLAASLISGFSQPLFNGGALKAEVERARAAAEESAVNYASTLLGAYREVEDAIDAEAILATREAALAVAAREAREAEKLAERDYANGLGTIFQLLDAQRRRLSAEGALISASAERITNRIALHQALGGDFGFSLPQDDTRD